MTAPRVELVAACPICGADRLRPCAVLQDRVHDVPGRFAYLQCRECETVFQAPRVIDADLASLYPREYYTHDAIAEAPMTPTLARPAGGRGVRDAVRSRIRAAVLERSGGALGGLLARSRSPRERAFFDLGPDEMIPRSAAGGRALDVGCGGGLQMHALRRLGWEVEGLEWDPAAAAAASRATGLPVHAGDVHALSGIGPYDLILVHHVLEHLRDPVAALASLRGVLAPGGRILLVYPNPSSLARLVYGEDWAGWDCPRHLVLPPVAAMPHAARRSGLRVDVARTTARNALSMLYHSRHARRGGRIDLTDPATERSDHLLARAEKAAVAMGLPLGEEAIVSLAEESVP